MSDVANLPWAGLTADPWTFDPAAAITVVNALLALGDSARDVLLDLGRTDVRDVAALQAARLLLEADRTDGVADTMTAAASELPHHPFLVHDGMPFLPVGSLGVGGLRLSLLGRIEQRFEIGRLRREALGNPDPRAAAEGLLTSGTWTEMIDAGARGLASRMVRWQAARTAGEALPTGLDLLYDVDGSFERWWAHS